MRKDQAFAGAQTQGDRPYQEDDFGFYWPNRAGEGADLLLAVMADGMGGHQGGAQASHLAVQAVLEVASRGDDPVGERLQRGLKTAVSRMGRAVEDNSGLEGMGCTLVAAAVGRYGLCWLSVGDSPMYLLRRGKLERLNEDQSIGGVLDEKARAGELTWEQARNARERNVLLSALGENEPELVDLRADPHPLEAGDVVLIGSDGIETLSEAELTELIQSTVDGGAQAVAEAVIAAVDERKKPGQDNATALALLPPESEPPPPGWRPATLPEAAAESDSGAGNGTQSAPETAMDSPSPAAPRPGKSGGRGLSIVVLMVLLLAATVAGVLHFGGLLDGSRDSLAGAGRPTAPARAPAMVPAPPAPDRAPAMVPAPPAVQPDAARPAYETVDGGWNPEDETPTNAELEEALRILQRPVGAANEFEAGQVDVANDFETGPAHPLQPGPEAGRDVALGAETPPGEGPPEGEPTPVAVPPGRVAPPEATAGGGQEADGDRDETTPAAPSQQPEAAQEPVAPPTSPQAQAPGTTWLSDRQEAAPASRAAEPAAPGGASTALGGSGEDRSASESGAEPAAPGEEPAAPVGDAGG